MLNAFINDMRIEPSHIALAFVLLALPLVPMHEQCPTPVRLQAGDIDAPTDAGQPHPFAALAALKGRSETP